METEAHTVPDEPIVNSVNPANALSIKREQISLLLVRFLVFMFGLFIMSFGIVAVVQANFGVSPWDVLHLGIVKHTGLSFGRVQQAVGILILTVAGLIMKKWPTFGAVANMILVGEFTDMIIRYHLVPEWEQPTARAALFVVGIIIWGMGTGVYIESRLGAGPRDWLMLALHEKTGVAIRWVRTGLEVMAVGLGFWLGGPFAIGTLIFSLTIGHVTEYGLRVAKGTFGRFTSPSA